MTGKETVEGKEIIAEAKSKMGFAPEIMAILKELNPEWLDLYKASDKVMWTDTALSAKNKVLLAMGILAGRLCGECVEQQMRSAVKHGATKEEILDVLGVVYVTAGAPGVYVCKDALKKLMKEGVL